MSKPVILIIVKYYENLKNIFSRIIGFERSKRNTTLFVYSLIDFLLSPPLNFILKFVRSNIELNKCLLFTILWEL